MALLRQCLMELRAAQALAQSLAQSRGPRHAMRSPAAVQHMPLAPNLSRSTQPELTGPCGHHIHENTHH